MNLAKINLNLLVVLNVLLEEKNVSIAAKRLFRTQSAVSTTLNQLRDLFQDRLLVRAQGGMMLTPLAERLVPQLSAVLGTINTFMENSREFIPEKSDRVFNIGVTEYLEFLFAIPLYQYFTKHAPNLKLDFKRIFTVMDIEEFKINSIDLILIDLYKKLPKSLSKEFLLRDKCVCAMRKGHTLTKKKQLTIKDYTKSWHLGSSQKSKLFKQVDVMFKKKGLNRHTPIWMSQIFSGMQFVETSDFIVTLPKLIAQQFVNRFNIVFYDLPFHFPEIELFQIWPSYSNEDRGLCWLREAVKTVANNISQFPPTPR